MKDEDWTARLFTEYLNAASTVLGDHKSLKSRDFKDIEARENRIRNVIGSARCSAVRQWCDYRFGSFGLFVKDGPGRHGRGEIWKSLAPEGVLRAIASRHEAVSSYCDLVLRIH